MALAVASSGIAALLLDRGRTFHSRFRASLSPMPGQSLNITMQSSLAKLIRHATLIVWDESPMMVSPPPSPPPSLHQRTHVYTVQSVSYMYDVLDTTMGTTV